MTTEELREALIGKLADTMDPEGAREFVGMFEAAVKATFDGFTVDDVAAMAQGAIRGLLTRPDIVIDELTRERLDVIVNLKATR